MKRSFILIAAMMASAITANAQTSSTEKKDSTMEKRSEMESIASGVTNGYLLIQNGVVKGYKTIESGVVKGFTSVNDSLTVKLFGKEGETVEQTKTRLKSNSEKAKTAKKK